VSGSVPFPPSVSDYENKKYAYTLYILRAWKKNKKQKFIHQNDITNTMTTTTTTHVVALQKALRQIFYCFVPRFNEQETVIIIVVRQTVHNRTPKA